ncbi:MAG TPA: winged helix-turn-helix transcriptional regulator [Allosphingosinicella sp.]|jgi:DNA-binding HxlR family transcriptional regulator
MPSQARQGYRQFCPVSKTAEIFAQRWTPLLVRELCFGPKRFSELQSALPLMSRSLLARRLDELRASGVIETEAAGNSHAYRLTRAGNELRPLIEAMSIWGQRWAQHAIVPDDLDPGSLLWSMKRQIEASGGDCGEMVVRFDFRGLPPGKPALRYWWLVLSEGTVDVCMQDPGREADVSFEADLTTLVNVWLGYEGLDVALREKRLSFHGSPGLVAQLRAILDLPFSAQEKTFRYHAPVR